MTRATNPEPEESETHESEGPGLRDAHEALAPPAGEALHVDADAQAPVLEVGEHVREAGARPQREQDAEIV